MSTAITRFCRATVGAAVLLGCSEGAPPTQPADRAEATPAVRIPTMTPSGDIGTAALPTVIYACYVAGKGSIYRIKADGTPAQCDKKDVEFSWTDPGANAGLITGLTFHSAANFTLNSTGRINFACAEGQSVVNFGYEQAAGNNTQPIGSRPTLTSVGIRWVFIAAPDTQWSFYWTCANAAPAVAAP